MEITTEYKNWITEMQARFQWGDKIIERASNDLKEEFPNINGLSSRNLKYCRQFYQFYRSTFEQQVVAKLSNDLLDKVTWGHKIENDCE